MQMKQAEKLKSREMKEGWWRMMKDDEGWWRMMKNDEGWMKNDERWRMNDERWWFQAVEGFWWLTVGRTFVNAESLSQLKIQQNLVKRQSNIAWPRNLRVDVDFVEINILLMSWI